MNSLGLVKFAKILAQETSVSFYAEFLNCLFSHSTWIPRLNVVFSQLDYKSGYKKRVLYMYLAGYRQLKYDGVKG